jgi:hypothetical protein
MSNKPVIFLRDIRSKLANAQTGSVALSPLAMSYLNALAGKEDLKAQNEEQDARFVLSHDQVEILIQAAIKRDPSLRTINLALVA